MTNQREPESLREFLGSFYYGSRADLNFKFLDRLTEDEAKAFISAILSAVGAAYDSGDPTDIVNIAIDAQAKAYAPDPLKPDKTVVHDEGPLTQPTKPIADSRVGLVTTSGHFVRGDDPEPFGVSGMTQVEAMARVSEFLRSSPILSEIPSRTPSDHLAVRHAGYDITSAELDPNVCFPIDVLRDLEADGQIGSAAATFFSFPGATAQGALRNVVSDWVERFRREHIDVLLLVPV